MEGGSPADLPRGQIAEDEVHFQQQLNQFGPENCGDEETNGWAGLQQICAWKI